jgi:Transposase
MPNKGHTEEQIIAALKQYEGGEKVTDICRKLSVQPGHFLPVEEAVCRVGRTGTA